MVGVYACQQYQTNFSDEDRIGSDTLACSLQRIPDPRAVEQQKHAYEKSLDAQLEQVPDLRLLG